jgi:hypothetical protein
MRCSGAVGCWFFAPSFTPTRLPNNPLSPLHRALVIVSTVSMIYRLVLLLFWFVILLTRLFLPGQWLLEQCDEVFDATIFAPST